MNQNVLISCGGKWVGLVIQFREAMRAVPAFRESRLLVADREALTPAGCFADEQIVVPSVTAPDYVERLLAACVQHEVGALIPHIEIDVNLLASHVDAFARAGVTIVGPNREVADLCSDKLAFAAFAAEEGLAHPRIYAASELDDAPYPLFGKDRSGFGAIGAGVVRSAAEARAALAKHPTLIFQELVEADELSVDAYIARDGRCVARIPRVRDQVIGGESMRGHTIGPSPASELADRTIAALARRGLRGPLLVQIFDGTRPTLVEVNPRIGSGTILSNIATGGRLFAMVLEEAGGGGASGDPDDYRANLRLYRYYGDVYSVDNRLLQITPSGA